MKQYLLPFVCLLFTLSIAVAQHPNKHEDKRQSEPRHNSNFGLAHPNLPPQNKIHYSEPKSGDNHFRNFTGQYQHINNPNHQPPSIHSSGPHRIDYNPPKVYSHHDDSKSRTRWHNDVRFHHHWEDFDRCFHEGRWDDLFIVFNVIILDWPEDYCAFYDSEEYHWWHQNDFDAELITAGREYARRNPQDPDRFMFEASVYYNEGKWNKVINLLNPVLYQAYIGKPSIKFYTWLYLSYERANDYQNELRVIRIALMDYPDDQQLQNQYQTLIQ